MDRNMWSDGFAEKMDDAQPAGLCTTLLLDLTDSGVDVDHL